VNPDSTECPSHVEEVAEAYIMDALTEKESAAFEDHYVGCQRCATALRKAAEYVEAIERAAKKLRTSGA
jgi:hypothetical protein